MRVLAACRLFLVLGATLIAPCGLARAENADVDTTHAPASPPILLKEKITERNPQAFARRLGDALGVEVRLPLKGFPQLSVPPGEWTATKMLNYVAKQMKGAGWQLRYEFTKRAPYSAPVAKPASKLPPAGPITLVVGDISFVGAIRLIQETATCVIKVPEQVPTVRFRLAWKDLPLETALQEMADAANMEVAPVVLFERDDAETQARRSEENFARANEQTLQQAQVANRLQEAYGQDPYDEDFPWENIDRERLTSTLAREMDLSAAEVDALIEQVRLDALTRAGMRQGE